VSPPGAPAPFIVGVPRSGTTLLRVMLDAHPELAVPPETGFVLEAARLDGSGDALRRQLLETLTGSHTWGQMRVERADLEARLEAIEPFDAADAVRAFYALYAERFGKRRWGDKTPIYRYRLAEIEEFLPEARFVHIIRDPRDVALSVRGLRFTPGEDPESIARDWRRGVLATREQGAAVSAYIELRYEDLVADPEPQLRRLCEAVELRFDPAMLDYADTARERLREIGLDDPDPRNPVPKLAAEAPDPSRVRRWKREMRRSDRAAVERVAGDLLEELGY
jgi:Sulfotransferase family